MIARAVVLFIRDYVRLFFGCLECRKHFLELSEYVFTELDGSHHGQAALWLWKAHNMVNLRLLMYVGGSLPKSVYVGSLLPLCVFIVILAGLIPGSETQSRRIPCFPSSCTPLSMNAASVNNALL
eukprot:m.343303 g.343303  ORF g.343303 m.343303 type:complete len:125 (+) comp55778_c0_seq7:215-589(+)